MKGFELVFIIYNILEMSTQAVNTFAYINQYISISFGQHYIVSDP